MKKIAYFIVLICITFLVSACSGTTDDKANSKPAQSASGTSGETVTADITFGEFSYKEDSQKYKSGDDGVVDWGLENTEKREIKDGYDAVSIAENEIKVIYDRVSADFDKEAQVWRIKFSLAGYESGAQTVYLDKDGKTIMYLWGIK